MRILANKEIKHFILLLVSVMAAFILLSQGMELLLWLGVYIFRSPAK